MSTQPAQVQIVSLFILGLSVYPGLALVSFWHVIILLGKIITPPKTNIL